MQVATESSVTFPNGRGKRGWVRFSFLVGDCNYREYGGTFISKRFHNGDWHYWLAIRVSPSEDDSGYYVSLEVVSPEAAERELFSASKCCGIEPEYIKNERDLVEMLLSYGVSTTIKTFQSKNFKKAMQLAHDEARGLKCFFGFYMDRVVNGFGATGWDAVAGNLYGPMKMPNDRVEPSLEESAKTDEMAAKILEILTPLKKRSQKIRDAGGY